MARLGDYGDHLILAINENELFPVLFHINTTPNRGRPLVQTNRKAKSEKQIIQQIPQPPPLEEFTYRWNRCIFIPTWTYGRGVCSFTWA